MIIKYVFIGMKKRLFVPLILMVMLLGQTIFPAHANTITFGSFDIEDLGSGSSAISDQIRVTVDFGGDFVGFGGVVFDLILSTADVGQTYTVSSGTEFDEAVVFLTNGINDSVSYDIVGYPTGGGSGTGSTEANFFFGDPTGANGIDFAGYDINSMSLTVNSLIIDTPGSDPNGDGLWTDIKFNAILKVSGVPVPAAVWLFGSGLLGLIGLSRRKKVA